MLEATSRSFSLSRVIRTSLDLDLDEAKLCFWKLPNRQCAHRAMIANLSLASRCGGARLPSVAPPLPDVFSVRSVQKEKYPLKRDRQLAHAFADAKLQTPGAKKRNGARWKLLCRYRHQGNDVGD